MFCNSRNHIKFNKTVKKLKLKPKQKLWKQCLKTKDTKTYSDLKKTSNQLRHLTRKLLNNQRKKGSISDQAKSM